MGLVFKMVYRPILRTIWSGNGSILGTVDLASIVVDEIVCLFSLMLFQVRSLINYLRGAIYRIGTDYFAVLSGVFIHIFGVPIIIVAVVLAYYFRV